MLHGTETAQLKQTGQGCSYAALLPCYFLFYFVLFSFLFHFLYFDSGSAPQRDLPPIATAAQQHSSPCQEVSSPCLNGKMPPVAALYFLWAEPRAVYSPELTSHTKHFKHKSLASKFLLGRGTAWSAGQWRGTGGGQGPGQDTSTSVPSAALLIKPIQGSLFELWLANVSACYSSCAPAERASLQVTKSAPKSFPSLHPPPNPLHRMGLSRGKGRSSLLTNPRHLFIPL